MNSSDIVLENFSVSNTTLLSIFPKENQRVRLSNLSVDYDYNIFTSDNDPDKLKFIIVLNVKCNEEEKPGYFIDIGAVGEFTLKNYKSIDNKTEKQYILFTALPLVINSTRTYIQNITSMHSFGQYKLPMLNLLKLIESKSNENESELIEE